MKRTGRIALATDLDGTFAHGARAVRAALHALLAAHPVTLIYITGRSAASAGKLIVREELPLPDMLVADIGTSVLRGAGPEHLEHLESAIASTWPGPQRIRAVLKDTAGLELQAVSAPRRVSYWIVENRDARLHNGNGDDFAARGPDDPSQSEAAFRIAEDAAHRASAALAGLDVDILISGNVYLDVLPQGVNKGSTLLRVLDELDIPVDSCVVAGDSLNDRALFEIGARGILVGNCEPALRAAVGERPDIYCARGHGAEGVLQGLRHYGVLPEDDGR